MNKIMIIIISCGIIAAFIFTFTFGYSIGKVRTNVPDTLVIKVQTSSNYDSKAGMPIPYRGGMKALK